MKNPEYCPLTSLISLQTLRPTRRSPASQSSRTNPSTAELNERIGPYSFLLRALNPDGSLWVKRMGHSFSRIGEMPAAQAASALGTIAAWRGTVLNHDRPILETELPIDGSRFEGIVSPVVRRPVFAIRLRPHKVFSLDDYEADGILTDGTDPLNQLRRRDDFLDGVRGLKHGEVIRAAVRARKNILVVGATGSGKTTLVNAILDSFARLTPHDRVISIEDTTELQCPVKNYLDLRAVGNVTMLECLRACMRLKPTRIVVGEVRGAEAHTLLKAWNTGHPGGAATVHANDALSAIWSDGKPGGGNRRCGTWGSTRSTRASGKSS
jgi:Flp pilus assembly CpaF family ATPase